MKILKQHDDGSMPSLPIVHNVCRELYHADDILNLCPKKVAAISAKRGGPLYTRGKEYTELIRAWLDANIEKHIDDSKPPDVKFKSLLTNAKADLKISLTLVHRLCRKHLQDYPSVGIRIYTIARLSQKLGYRSFSSILKSEPINALVRTWEDYSIEQMASNLLGNTPGQILSQILSLQTSPRVKRNLLALHNTCKHEFEHGCIDFLYADIVRKADVSFRNPRRCYRDLITAWAGHSMKHVCEASDPLPAMNALKVGLQNGSNRRHWRRFILVHEVCRAQFSAGKRDFSSRIIGGVLEESGLITLKQYRRSLSKSPCLLGLVKAWASSAGGTAEETKEGDNELLYLLKIDPKLENWRCLASEWLNLQIRGRAHKRAAIEAFFLDYISKYDLARDPAIFEQTV